ncbi:MAG: hypothetical protein KKA19_01675, partial [Candidatus Margulisbacteria bacterium]|nr:hypothetical protein [Candidatus Margulisiibacteriota bacterium]
MNIFSNKIIAEGIEADKLWRLYIKWAQVQRVHDFVEENKKRGRSLKALKKIFKSKYVPHEIYIHLNKALLPSNASEYDKTKAWLARAFFIQRGKRKRYLLKKIESYANKNNEEFIEMLAQLSSEKMFFEVYEKLKSIITEPKLDGILERYKYLGKTIEKYVIKLKNIYLNNKPGKTLGKLLNKFQKKTCNDRLAFKFFIKRIEQELELPEIRLWGHIINNNFQIRDNLQQKQNLQAIKIAKNIIAEKGEAHLRKYFEFYFAGINAKEIKQVKAMIFEKNNIVPKNIHEENNYLEKNSVDDLIIDNSIRGAINSIVDNSKPEQKQSEQPQSEISEILYKPEEINVIDKIDDEKKKPAKMPPKSPETIPVNKKTNNIDKLNNKTSGKPAQAKLQQKSDPQASNNLQDSYALNLEQKKKIFEKYNDEEFVYGSILFFIEEYFNKNTLIANGRIELLKGIIKAYTINKLDEKNVSDERIIKFKGIGKAYEKTINLLNQYLKGLEDYYKKNPDKDKTGKSLEEVLQEHNVNEQFIANYVLLKPLEEYEIISKNSNNLKTWYKECDFNKKRSSTIQNNIKLFTGWFADRKKENKEKAIEEVEYLLNSPDIDILEKMGYLNILKGNKNIDPKLGFIWLLNCCYLAKEKKQKDEVFFNDFESLIKENNLGEEYK